MSPRRYSKRNKKDLNSDYFMPYAIFLLSVEYFGTIGKVPTILISGQSVLILCLDIL